MISAWSPILSFGARVINTGILIYPRIDSLSNSCSDFMYSMGELQTCTSMPRLMAILPGFDLQQYFPE